MRTIWDHRVSYAKALAFTERVSPAQVLWRIANRDAPKFRQVEEDFRTPTPCPSLRCNQ
jgi:hypothetical protein